MHSGLLETTQKKKMVPNKRFPTFIKPYYPPNSRKSLKLPPPFTSFVKEILPIKPVLLRDHYNGKFWAVEVAKIGGDLFFQAGWTEFLEDNSLEFGDFLVFQYNGGDEFHFKILRETAERIDTMAAMDFSSNKGLQEDGDAEKEVQEKIDTVAARDFSSNEGLQEDGDVEKEVQEERIVTVAVRDFSSNEGLQEDGDVEEEVQEETGNGKKNTSEGEEEEVVEELEEVILIKNLGKRKRSSGAKTRESSTYSMASMNSEAQGKVTAVKSKDQDFRSNVNPLQNPFHGLQNPYFLVKHRKSKSNQVYVPQGVVKTFRAQLLPKMIIRDPSGKEWSTKLYTRKDKTMWMQGGWSQFALHHNVKEKDRLACELVPMRDRRGSYIQLHIHRMTQELQSNCRPSGH